MEYSGEGVDKKEKQSGGHEQRRNREVKKSEEGGASGAGEQSAHKLGGTERLWVGLDTSTNREGGKRMTRVEKSAGRAERR